ncbi:phosphatidylserine decarboxylase family protein [bacterium]|nr:phosphatidylserine decarboxylase family protein [bacterium]MCP5462866.1 phosphatidylserine decarboxylase family protein [bacterium]
MKLPVAKEVMPYFIPTLIVTIGVGILNPIAGYIGVVLCIYLLYFFRNPTRSLPEGKNLIVSPADGKIVGIDVVEPREYFTEKMWRISIFLNIFNVHINYAPITATIAGITYKKGSFLPANAERSSIQNENNMVILRNTGNQLIGVRQIAGMIARRIVCDCSDGDTVMQGDRIGLIKFSSRVEIFLPLTAKIVVTNGDRVKGKTTILGLMK